MIVCWNLASSDGEKLQVKYQLLFFKKTIYLPVQLIKKKNNTAYWTKVSTQWYKQTTLCPKKWPNFETV